jgi:hypothetical protein
VPGREASLTTTAAFLQGAYAKLSLWSPTQGGVVGFGVGASKQRLCIGHYAHKESCAAR